MGIYNENTQQHRYYYNILKPRLQRILDKAKENGIGITALVKLFDYDSRRFSTIEEFAQMEESQAPHVPAGLAEGEAANRMLAEVRACIDKAREQTGEIQLHTASGKYYQQRLQETLEQARVYLCAIESVANGVEKLEMVITRKQCIYKPEVGCYDDSCDSSCQHYGGAINTTNQASSLPEAGVSDSE